MKLTRKTLDLEVDTTLTNKELAHWRGAKIGRILLEGVQPEKTETVTVIQIGVNTITPAKKDTKIRRR